MKVHPEKSFRINEWAGADLFFKVYGSTQGPRTYKTGARYTCFDLSRSDSV